MCEHCLYVRMDVCSDVHARGTLLHVHDHRMFMFHIITSSSPSSGHTVRAVTECFALSKDAGFKIIAHMMPDLPNMGMERDLEGFREYFYNPEFRSDGLKIYPTLVIRGTGECDAMRAVVVVVRRITRIACVVAVGMFRVCDALFDMLSHSHTHTHTSGLYELWKTGAYKNYSPDALIDLIAKILALVPPWTRVYRIQRCVAMWMWMCMCMSVHNYVDVRVLVGAMREHVTWDGVCVACCDMLQHTHASSDIPMPLVTSGVDHGNIRELVLKRMADLGLPCRDVRTREVGIMKIHHKVCVCMRCCVMSRGVRRVCHATLCE